MENRGRSISAPELEKLEAQLQEKKKSTTLSSDFMKILKSVTKAALAPGKGKLKFACIGALVYFINPIDLVPDYLGPIGLVDDFAVLSWVATLILPSQVAKLKRSKTTVDES
ncbi:MAG: DUF1232 domain-containing protein [Cryobacterium sp.]|nr:DUF1232 domain-containing protein [Oligoflexia bacterium]